MMEYKRRCKHCLDEYYYQASGHGCFRKENHKQYCPTCALARVGAIETALAAIPKKFEEKWVDVEEGDMVTPELMKQTESKRIADAVKDDKLGFKQVIAGMFRHHDDGTWDSTDALEQKHGGVKYFLSWWRRTGEIHRFQKRTYVPCSTLVNDG